MSVRALGVLALILGLLVWPVGLAIGNIHMLVGILLVLAALVLGGSVLQNAAARLPGVALIVLALLQTWLGVSQVTLLPGDTHWVIRVVHLLLGLLVIGLGEMVGARGRRSALLAA